ncbi:hypothetical protein EV363DRAFT_1298203 [Boletus edulis]|nr:hypothetical protein EV363DRAFT_1298203 [Boletus edulis]
MDPIIPSGKYILSLPTTAGTYYLGPLQDKPDTIGVLPEDISPLPTFTLINDGAFDEYKISIGELCVDKMRDGSLYLKADNSRCKKWRIVSSGNETYMSVSFANWRRQGDPNVLYRIKGGKDSCWSSPRFQAQKQAGFPAKDADKCDECSTECVCDSQEDNKKCDNGTCPACKNTSGDDNMEFIEACTVCPPSCLAFKFVPV